jgi:hypothetical protein
MIMDDGRYKQIGITSFGLVFGCELGLHAAFTRTSKSRIAMFKKIKKAIFQFQKRSNPQKLGKGQINAKLSSSC